MTNDLAPMLIIIGLLLLCATALIAVVFKNSRVDKFVQGLLCLAALVGITGAGAYFLQSGATRAVLVQAGSWVLQVDTWSALFALVINGGLLITALYGGAYLKQYTTKYSSALVNSATAIFAASMLAVIFSCTAVSFLFFWEIMSLAAYFLVIADREAASLAAGRLYLVMAHLGFVCLLAAFMLISGGHLVGTFDQIAIGNTLGVSTMGALAFFLFFAGFGSKAGLVPLHQWLPYAHPQAPSHSSALLSGVMLNVAVYGFLRVIMLFFPAVPTWWAIVVVVVGLLSALFGVLYASVEIDLKRLLAWSSIENLGLIFSAIGLGLYFLQSNTVLAIIFFTVALMHMVNHAIFKLGLFLAAGAIIGQTHTRNINEMGGLARAWPGFSKWFFGLAIGAMALPPLGTFYGEWLYLQGILSSLSHANPIQSVMLVVVLAVIGLVGGLAVFTFAKTFSVIFLGRARTEGVEHASKPATALVIPMAITVVMLVATGFFAPVLQRGILSVLGVSPILATSQQSVTAYLTGSLLDLSVRGADSGFKPFIAGLLIVGAIGVVFLKRKILSKEKTVQETGTWDCGQEITPRMQYSATGFAGPIRFFFRSLLLIDKKIVAIPVTSGNSWITKKTITGETRSIWEEGVYNPVIKAVRWVANRVSTLQNGIIQYYLLFILVTIIVVVLLAL